METESARVRNISASVDNERNGLSEAFRRAASTAAPANIVAKSALREAFGSNQETPQLTSEQKQLIEIGLRSLVLELSTEAALSEKPVLSYGSVSDPSLNSDDRGILARLLDVCLNLSETGMSESGMIFTLLEDLLEVSTIENCKQIFDYIKTKQETLRKHELLTRGKLILLRACNQLLKRLSKTYDVVFCGQILMFLANFFSVSERSAANIKGTYNTANKTEYEKDIPMDLLETVDFEFYSKFWGLQEYFCNPPLLLNAAKWQAFIGDLDFVLDTFEKHPITNGHLSLLPLDNPGTNPHSLENGKYLTSPNLLSLQMEDKTFRRNFLLQCLIVCGYLRSPPKSEKEDKRESMRESLRSLKDRVHDSLSSLSGSDSVVFMARAALVLEREKNWAKWKKENCPNFEKPKRKALECPVLDESTLAVRQRKVKMGNPHLDKIFKRADAAPSWTDSSKVKRAKVEEFYIPMAENLDPEAGIEEEYFKKNDKLYCWHAFRLSSEQDIAAFQRMDEVGIHGVIPPSMLVDSAYETLYKKKRSE